VRMKHKAHGLDSQGKLKMDVSLEGHVPETNPFTEISIKVNQLNFLFLIELVRHDLKYMTPGDVQKFDLRFQ